MKTKDLIDLNEKLTILRDKDNEVFSDNYIPDEIMFRDNEIETIIKDIAGNHNVYIIGNIGTGKTVIVKWIVNNLKKLNKDDKILYIYQSCRQKTYSAIWYNISNKIGINTSQRQSIATYSSAIYDYVKNKNISKINLILDEADEVSGRYNDPDLLYLFGDTSYFTCVLVGNTQEWIDNIGIRTSSRLGGRIIRLNQYNEIEIREILKQRVELSSNNTPITYEEIEMISEGVMKQLISLRDAIKVISKLYDYKKFSNKEAISLSKSIIHKFFKQVKDDSLIKYYNAHPPVLQMIIVCATLLLSKTGKESFSIQELGKVFNDNTNTEIGEKSLSSIRRYIKELETYGFFKEGRKSKSRTGYNLIYTPKFNVEEFMLYFRTERIIK